MTTESKYPERFPMETECGYIERCADWYFREVAQKVSDDIFRWLASPEAHRQVDASMERTMFVSADLLTSIDA